MNVKINTKIYIHAKEPSLKVFNVFREPATIQTQSSQGKLFSNLTFPWSELNIRQNIH